MTSLLGGPLVTPGSPIEPEQVHASEEAKHSAPEAVRTRQESRTKYEGLSGEEAANVDREAYPGLVDETAGGPPKLAAGQSIRDYLANNVAQVNLPGGKHGVIESVGPMAVETSAGHWTPIDLGLHGVEGAFEPQAPMVGVRIPTRLGEGVRLSSSGVSLTPVNAQGQPSGGSEGAQEGASVIYANTQTDTDTLAKPITGGFELDTLLRSIDSPEALDFKVGMPSGASLVSDPAPGGASVVLDGQAIARIALPSAQDAAGTNVPVQMSVSGDTVIMTVAHNQGEYQYPIEVDPHAYDETILLSSNCTNHESGENTNWEFSSAGGSFECSHDVNGVEMHWVGVVNEGSYDELRYPAHGESSVTFIEAKYSLSEDLGVTHLAFVHESTVEEQYQLGGTWEEHREVEKGYGDKIKEGVEGFGALYHENELRIQQTATSNGNEHQGFWFELFNGSYVGVLQEQGPSVSFDTSDPTISEADGRQNVLYKSGRWLGEHNGAVAITATDPGMGVSYVKIKDLTAGPYGEHWTFIDPVYQEHLCTGIWCSDYYKTYFTYNKEMADGTNTFELCGEDQAFMEACTDVTGKVDNTPPTNIKLTGFAESGAELSTAPHQVTIEATDATSGVKSITVLVDGKEIGSPTASCSPGECTASRTVTIDGEGLGAGEHKLEMFATDYSDNVSSEKVVTFAIRHATPVRLGPGTVDPTTGQFALSASDVDIAGAGRVSRTYLSRSLDGGAEGPLGPQWTMSVGSGQSLEVLPDGNIELRSSVAESAIFEKEGKRFIAPKGDENITLEAVEKEGKVSEYLLERPSAGTTTRFTLPSKSRIWVPEATEGPGGRDEVRYAYRTVEPVSGQPITEPIEELGPVSPGVTCGNNPAQVSQAELQPRLAELLPGCRTLSFTYAEETTATGDAASEWGDYNGRLARVSFTGYNPSSKAMETIAVAQYLYDGHGRLRAEWDPRIEKSTACGGVCSALKTTYGYDEEGHVTALTPAGQESWAFTYGTIVGDASTGRLLKVTRAQAGAQLWNGEAPTNGERPTISGIAEIGQTLSASRGSWRNGPVAYRYQWDDCNTEGQDCTPIPGATNANYSPSGKDIGKTLVVYVSATNGGGSTAVTSETHPKVSVTPIEYGLPAEREPSYITAGSDGNLWYTELGWSGTNDLGKITTSGSHTEYATPGKWDNGITEGPDNKLWYLSEDFKSVVTSNTAGEQKEYYYKEGYAHQITSGPNGDLWFTLSAGGIDEMTTSGTVTTFPLLHYYEDARGITVGPDGNLWFTAEYSGTGVIGKITTSGAVTEYELPAESLPERITAGRDGNLWYTDKGAGKIGKITTYGHITEYALPSGSCPFNIATGSEGNLWFTENCDNKIGIITTSGEVSEISVPAGSEPYDIAIGPDNDAWYTDRKSGKIGKIPLGGATGDPGTPQPGLTIEYHVPLSGSGAPYQMTSAELAKWDQKKDLPEEATAIFPPDEPQGWPASDFKRASIGYLDAQGREVDAVTPSGGIATTEYNSLNEVVRTLSAANRATALKEGCESETKCRSAEVAATLDSESKYNGETQAEKEREEKEGKREPGMRLLEKLGPEHRVRLANGTEEETRDHQKFSYNEGAPSGETYDLATKALSWAETTAGEELGKRETVTSYSGQKDLGWELRKPTSVTSEPEGVDRVQSKVYEEATGNLLETIPSGGNQSQTPSYVNEFGSSGTGNNQYNEPTGIGINPNNGMLAVSDELNNRVEEYNDNGEYLRQFGTLGTGNGEFKEPRGVAVDSKGDVWVTDTGNNRVEEFSETGMYLGQFGTSGSGNGQFDRPKGLAFDSKGDLWVVDSGNERVEEFNQKDEYVLQFSAGTNPIGVAFNTEGDVWSDNEDASGAIEEHNKNGELIQRFAARGEGNGQVREPKRLTIVKGYVWVPEAGNNRIEIFTEKGEYVTTFGGYGTGSRQMNYPTSVAIDPKGNVWITDNNNRVDRWKEAPSHPKVADTQMTYYSAKEEATVPACRNHPEWAGLACQTQPAEQPVDSPKLPVSTITYNIWDEAERTEEKFGSGSEGVTRTKIETYDAAGRVVSSEESTSPATDTTVPAVSDEYSPESGAMVKLTSTIEGHARTITSAYNTLGQLTSYTDAEGATTKYVYNVDGRIEEVVEPKGSQIYAYDATTGFMTRLLDSAAGTFTATYDVEGKMLTEGYPNGMAAKYTYNTIGQATNLEYEKTTNCSEKCVWLSDSDAFGPKGELSYQASTLSTETYSYNEAGELIQAQETPAGQGCTVRLYIYDEEGNRLSQTTREPGSEGQCATEGGTVQQHTYDEAGRLTDEGVQYETFGNITKLPAAGTGEGAHPLQSSYYLDGQVATQEQNEKAVSYTYDPAGRKMIAATKTTSATYTTIEHYAGPGEALTWTCEEAGECKEEQESKWTRNIPGIDGSLDAVQENGGMPVLQLHDLQGNVIATASLSETATELLTKHNVTEFGVPVGTAPKYSWLGADGAQSELGTGVITEVGATYVPQLALTLQAEQAIPPGAAANGVMDTESYSPPELPWSDQAGAEGAASAVAEQRALEVVAVEGAIDPWGLLTGKEALEFAAEFNGWAEDVENYLKNAEHCNAECELAGEADSKSDRWMAHGLEVCHHEVHNPHHVKAYGKIYEITYVCLLHLDYSTNYGNWVFAKPDSGLWVCDSLPFGEDGRSPWGDHGSQEWLCGVDGKEQWWVFGNNRGWWRKIL